MRMGMGMEGPLSGLSGMAYKMMLDPVSGVKVRCMGSDGNYYVHVN
jgi:hypothetical protein